ncbi:hypothetical protein [Caulobacter sp.]|jgi:hypothetical protein|uniref:hypothetical protein n=1 Tax=Caulobacter sp. TaxID=78 RepID=UPI001621BB62
MDERVAEAVVELVQQTTMLTDLSQVATKAEISELATKAELKTEIASVRSDLKSEIALVRADMALMESRLRADLSEKIRLQGWAILGGMAVLVTISTALIKLVP